MDYQQARATEEALLQSYRQIMIGSQSIFLALGAVLIDKGFIALLVISLICIFQIWWIWFRIVYSRAKAVDFYKFRMNERYNEWPCSEVNLRLKLYIDNRKLRKTINEELKIKTFRPTRLKLDLILPITFTLMWISFTVFEALSI